MLPVIRGQVATAFSLFARAVSKARWKAALFLFSVALLLAGGAAAVPTSAPASTVPTNLSGAAAAPMQAPQQNSNIQVGQSYHNDVSPPLRDLAPLWPAPESKNEREQETRTGNLNPNLPYPQRMQVPGLAGEHDSWLKLLGPDIPGPILVFDGIVPCAGCRPKTNGEAGATQYVQVVALSYQVFDKASGMSLLGPNTISSLWSGFGGACQTSSMGDAIVLYDQITGRWFISQLAGSGVPTDACIAISTTDDATGTWNRYGFHLGNNFLSAPRLSVWPDGYYMSVNVFNSSGTAFLGPQPFAFERTKMLAGLPATVITPGITGSTEPPYLPADLDGSTMPPAGAPNSFVGFPSDGTYRVFHFHADFTTPANTSFTLFASPQAAPFTPLCANCVPQAGTMTTLDGVINRLMFRLAYRNLGTASVPNESLVGNYTVSSGGVAGVHWFELKNVTSGPVVIGQENTYQPDTTWRWLGSAAMDHAGDLAIGFSASSPSINPQIRYAGRLATDPPNTLAQGEAILYAGTGSQTGSNNWGDISDLTIDPVDDCTFWYTNEYVSPGSSVRTLVGSFRFAECNAAPSPTPTPTPIIDLGISMTDSPDPVEVGLDLTYTITVSNNVPDTALGVTMTDTLPPDVIYVSAAPSQGSCTGTSTVTCNLGTIGSSASATVVLVVTPTVAGQLSNTAVVPFPGDPNPSNNSSTVETTVIPRDTLSPTPTPTPPGSTPTPTPSPTSSPTPTPSSTPTPGRPLNLSTRLRVQSGDNVGIGGFIITGTAPTQIFLRGIGPSLSNFGVPDPLADPVMELHGPPGFTTIVNDNWRDGSPVPPIVKTGLAPTNDLESAILATLDPGAYTAIVKGKDNTSGVGLVEVYDLDQAAASKLGNISTRAFVGTGADIVIAGFILGGSTGDDHVVLRGIGPSLSGFGVPNALADPALELRDSNGTLLAYSNDWQDGGPLPPWVPSPWAPTNPLESVIAATLSPGQYTALLAGVNGGTGVGLVEVYDLGSASP